MGKKVGILSIAILGVATLAASAAYSMDLAKVNGKTITDRDMRSALEGLNPGQRDTLLKDARTRRQVLQSLIDQEVVVQEGEKQKLDQDADYKAALANFRKQYILNKVLEKNLGSKLTEAAAKKHYESNKSKWSTDQVHVQHILLADELQARDVLKKAQEKGADFQALAEKYSRDPSAKNNRGDLGVITRDAPFVEEFKEAAFSGKEGEIVGPVKTSFGYHLIKVVEKKLGHPMTYDEVELKVKGDLRQSLIKEYVANLKAQSKISVDDKALDKM